MRYWVPFQLIDWLIDWLPKVVFKAAGVRGGEGELAATQEGRQWRGSAVVVAAVVGWRRRPAGHVDSLGGRRTALSAPRAARTVPPTYSALGRYTRDVKNNLQTVITVNLR